MTNQEIKEAQGVLQAMTFTIAQHKEIPKDKETTDMLLTALGTGIRAMQELQQYQTIGTVEDYKHLKELESQLGWSGFND